LQKVDKEDETVPLLDQLVKERTDLKALDQLGQYFEKNKDYEKAQNFYLSAVLKGYNDSIFRLGALY
jgi:TPR repeat protein